MPYNYPSFPLHMDAPLFEAFRDQAPRAGTRAIDGTLYRLDGSTMTLKKIWKAGPVVIEFGSFG